MMVSRSKILPIVALGVVLTFSWCYAFTGSTYAAIGSGEVGGMPQTSAEPDSIEASAARSFCTVCPAVAASTVKPEFPSATPSREKVTPPAAMFFPTAPLSLHENRDASSTTFAPHRASLFQQAILIRI
jgi:hypothetical protein